MGRAKAAVLPVPVWAWPITSWPAIISGMIAAWMGMGVSIATLGNSLHQLRVQV